MIVCYAENYFLFSPSACKTLGYASYDGLSCSTSSTFPTTLYFVFGSGGGASDIRIGGTALSNRVLVAGAGGGGGVGQPSPTTDAATGGDGGYTGGCFYSF